MVAGDLPCLGVLGATSSAGKFRELGPQTVECRIQRFDGNRRTGEVEALVYHTYGICKLTAPPQSSDGRGAFAISRREMPKANSADRQVALGN